LGGVTTPGSSDIRIGDREREQAITVLGEHYTAGRLDIDEYGERTAKVTAARTRGDLAAVFTDLPEPHPTLSPPSAATAPRAADVAPPPPPKHFQRRRLANATVGLTWLAAILLMVTFRNHYVIFIPIVLTILFGAYWGNGRRYEAGSRRRTRRRHLD
jgi:hypothetical protein